MKVPLLFTSCALILLASCSSMPNSDEFSLTESQLQEIRELEDVAIQSIELPLEGDWVTIAPGVSSKTVVHDNGGESHELRASGLSALEWVGVNVWQPRMDEIEAMLATGAELTRRQIQELRFEQKQLVDRMDILDQWRHLESTLSFGPESVTTLSCTAVARASAVPTTASVGAKAYASARTCTQGKIGYARAVVEPPYTVHESWASPGNTASASEVAYGADCSSAGLADGYPEYADVWYHCP